MARIAIIGANGQLGVDLLRQLQQSGHEVIAWTHQDLEITDRGAATRAIGDAKPEWVINTAAINVEASEVDPARAFAVNEAGSRNVAEAAAAAGARTLQVGTDYVFDGAKGAPYVESDPVGPLNPYGASKLAGEQAVLAVDPANLAIRGSGLYGVAGVRAKNGMNFVTTMLALGRSRDSLSVVADERLSPTCTADLAAFIEAAIAQSAGGIVHATAAGGCSWFEFASAIFELAAVEVELSETTGAEFGASAAVTVTRPSDTRLESERLGELGLTELDPWRTQLERYLRAIDEL
jgi:dTDP-4-dehydrorhamnose reductase